MFKKWTACLLVALLLATTGLSSLSIQVGAVMYGDVSGDGDVNMKDVLVLRKSIAGMKVDIDLVAADVNGEYRGEITGVDDQTANVLFEVTLKDDDRQLLIPAVDEMISDIDFDEQRVVFEVSEDLLELMLDN